MYELIVLVAFFLCIKCIWIFICTVMRLRIDILICFLLKCVIFKIILNKVKEVEDWSERSPTSSLLLSKNAMCYLPITNLYYKLYN